MSQTAIKPEPKNGDFWMHNYWGLVEVIKPWGDTVKTHESVCEVVTFRPKKIQKVMRHELMLPLALRQVLQSDRPLQCNGCEKDILPGKDHFRLDSPADKFGPALSGDICNGCMNMVCHGMKEGRSR